MKIKDKYYGTDEVAEYLGVSKKTIYNMIKNKGMPCRQLVQNGKILFDITEIDEWLNGKKK